MEDNQNNNNGQAWVAPQNDVDMDLEDDEEDEEEEEGEDDSDDDGEDDDEEDDGVQPIPDVLGLSGFSVFDGGIADDDIEEDNVTTAATGGKPQKATEADIVRCFFFSRPPVLVPHATGRFICFSHHYYY
jgi:hypothetical protein